MQRVGTAGKAMIDRPGTGCCDESDASIIAVSIFVELGRHLTLPRGSCGVVRLTGSLELINRFTMIGLEHTPSGTEAYQVSSARSLCVSQTLCVCARDLHDVG
jgi:hypothetical protein